MTMRSTDSTVTFSGPFPLSGLPDQRPTGACEVFAEDAPLQGRSVAVQGPDRRYLADEVRRKSMSRQAAQPAQECISTAATHDRSRPMGPTSKTIAVFARPFNVPGFDETLPAGEYEIETEDCAPPDRLDPDAWKASVFVKLHTRASHPGLERILTVSLIDLDRARARDKASGKDLTDVFLEDMLSDPLVLLVMQADGVSEAQLRHLYSGSRMSRGGDDEPVRNRPPEPRKDDPSISAAENEGMPVRI